MRKLQITTGKIEVKGRINLRVIATRDSLDYPICDLSTFDKSLAETKTNAELIKNTFITAQLSDKLPSEMFTENQQMHAMLVRVRQWYEENQHRLGDYTPVVFSEILSLIQTK